MQFKIDNIDNLNKNELIVTQATEDQNLNCQTPQKIVYFI